MSSPLERPLKIEIRLPSSDPQLLEGLDIWLRLGLISDAQVRQLCREFLICAVVLQPQVEAQTKVVFATSDPVQQLPIAALQASSGKQPQQKPAKPNFISIMLQSLGAELSVRWLLFLGVFLVVVSSGVLAASQWARFPASGQYGVLFAYTLSFWGLSFWATRQNNLRLTAQTLLIATLLLVPVNFWAMDSFRLWQNPVDWIVVAIAFPTLTAITVLLSKNQTIFTNLHPGKLPLANILGLSYLHWGWQLRGFPLIAVYLATIATTIITVYHNLFQQPHTVSDDRRRLSISLPATVIIYSLIVLLVRAIFVTKVDVTLLGLAIGICGWLMIWLAQQGRRAGGQGSRGAGEQGGRGAGEAGEVGEVTLIYSSSPLSPSSLLLWERLGGVLLFLGWLVSVVNYPWQAIAVSGLGLWFVGSRLRRYSLKRDFAGVFVIGLETILLSWRLVPDNLQKLAIATGTQLTNSQNEPWALLGIALFPYVILMVALTDSLYRSQKRELAKFGELLTLLFGAFLTTIAIVNPTLRSLNLLFSTATLAFVTQRRSPSSLPLVYLTHIMGVLTFCFTINWLFPSLTQQAWASILLALMVAEWRFSLEEGLWQRSAWDIGLGLAAASFFLLWMNAESSWYGIADSRSDWGVLWLVTPLALTGVANATIIERQITSRYLSVLAVIIAQLVTLQLSGIRLIGLAVGAGLMFANTRYLRNQVSALITEGFVLSFIGVLLWTGIPGLPRLAVAGWFVAGAIATLSLWLARTVLSRRGNELAVIYAAASDKWAITLCGLELLGLTLHSVLIYQGFTTSGFLFLIATAIALAAIVYRSWREPTNWAFYGIGWCLELLISQVLGLGERSIVRIAIANIALGLITQLVGEWWRRRHQLERFPSSLHILPLIYGAFSILLRLNTFTEWTGLYSLGAALIVIGVGRRRESFKPLLYLGIIGVSISAYELLFYQMSQASGGALGDGLIAMSALGASIMYAYRILSPWLVSYFRLTPEELKRIAHIHWVWGSCLLMAAIPLPIGVNRLVGLATGVFLIRYAIFQGRNSPTSPNFFGGITIAEMWVYLGLLEVAGMRIYWRETAVGRFWAGPLVPWNGAIACVVAYFLYILPWESWGWSKRPWQQAAYIIPLIILWETRLQTYPITLVLAAGFYIFLAKVGENIRFTYISVALIDWALYRWFDSLRLTDTLWYITPIGLSLLYIALVDTQLRLPEYKTPRHILRVLGSGLICGWAILFHQNTAWIPGIFSLIAIFAGLALRVRAFLYIGTATFLITTIYQSVIFSLQYSFLKWVVGLLVGILLIYIAANFETRRAQITSLIRSAIDEFQSWE
ncbi:DUF2157 domain-containing protein [Nostoc sp. 'Lobaria pulmonaria (5183) cyanobiont']|uniref:DUF2157 domain-containing protein n=1 Tax=Nostoc sp. 'Lobaria pulmonaria (5183) cyanobiont' TaxID=1618022 RepID=UPI000CF3085F|nr:DUF2157 domain-containing protein [Nostoc sp. 'Lobaria pulmonaria (5183) cyanobiont']AVH72688.1 hypothetical protein NLP_4240 [Nostoc sp. 'Lobaria pulmonaria (5183) cyanobiont']